MFIVFEGVDGAGKSTQLTQLVNWLKSRDHQVVACKDPGSTRLGEQIRSILLGKHETPISMRAEMMLFTTARSQLVDEIVRPALESGKTVVLDRYLFSTIVYQGYAGELDTESIRKVNHVATGGLMPDLAFFLDLPVEVALTRIGDSPDRMESRGAAYLQKVRDGFIHESERWPTGIELIDANRSQDEVFEEIRALTEKALP